MCVCACRNVGVYACMYVCLFAYVCVCECVCERERERVYVCVCLCMRACNQRLTIVVYKLAVLSVTDPLHIVMAINWF